MGRGKESAAGVWLALIMLAVGLGVAFGFAMGWLPDVATIHGKGIDRTIHYLLVATGIIYLIAHVALSIFILRFSRDKPRPNAIAKPATEAKIALVPVILMMAVSEIGVLVVGLPVFSQVYGEPPEDAYEIEVVGKQFEWLARYPGPDGIFGTVDPELVHDARNPLGLDKNDPAAMDDIVRRGVVAVPVNRTSVIRLRSLDVIHSFTVPIFRTKQDMLPGFTARTMFVPERTGEFEIACAELCGLGHFRMQGTVVVMTEEELAQWLSEQEPWL